MPSKLAKKRKALIISAHPDDDTLVGGTIAKLVSRGWRVYEFVCTEGNNGKLNKEESKDSVAGNRLVEIYKFSSMLGMEKPYVYKNQNQFLKLGEEIVLKLVEYARRIRPDVFILLNDEDYHFEHRESHEIGLRAIEIAFRATLLELGPRIERGIILKTDGLNVLSNPLISFDVSEKYALKIRAMKRAYKKRLGKDILQFDEGLATLRGGRAKCKYAESYKLVNPTWYRLNTESSEILTEFVKIGS